MRDGIVRFVVVGARTNLQCTASEASTFFTSIKVGKRRSWGDGLIDGVEFGCHRTGNTVDTDAGLHSLKIAFCVTDRCGEKKAKGAVVDQRRPRDRWQDC